MIQLYSHTHAQVITRYRYFTYTGIYLKGITLMSINDYYFNKLHCIKDSSNSIYHDISILMVSLCVCVCVCVCMCVCVCVSVCVCVCVRERKAGWIMRYEVKMAGKTMSLKSKWWGNPRDLDQIWPKGHVISNQDGRRTTWLEIKMVVCEHTWLEIKMADLTCGVTMEF